MSPARIERRTIIAGVLIIAAVLVVAMSTVIAGAEEVPAIVAVPVANVAATVTTVAPSVTATNVPSGAGSYALDFTLPTFGKSGCLVCHGDRNLVVAKGDSTKSFWVDEVAYNHSAHATVVCTGCHIDYGYKSPHGQTTGDWRSIAKQSCKNCHPDQFRDWSLGGHAVTPTADKKPDPKAASKPLCGDCHGGHDMAVLKNNPEAKRQIRETAQQMCGREGCHADYWANYSDYYHGAAYKTGAQDAPTCWDCHGTHTVLKSTDRFSPTNTDNLGAANSCGSPGCHSGAGSAYASYAPMIHGRAKIAAENPIARFLDSVFKR
ncbi:MAG TPA: hypothetical protein VIL17_02690 [Coriobacteriia bacterium]